MSPSKSDKTQKSSDRPARQSLKFLDRTHLAVRSHMADTIDLSTFLESGGILDLEGRKLLVEQALILISENYVHLPLKESMHGVDPVQRLRLVKHRLEEQTAATMESEYEFHRQMLEIFNSVRDLHTNYLLPAPFNSRAAFLPFDIEEYYDDDEARYMASHFVQGFSHRHFKPGVEVTMWNGVPISRAIEVNANRHAGSNMAARHVRGVDGLTLRPLRTSLPPDELWVVIGYIDLEGIEREMRQEWLVSEPPSDAGGVDANTAELNAASLGIDLEVDINRRMKKLLFAPKVMAQEYERSRILSAVKAEAGESVISSMPGVFKAKSVPTPLGVFGYIRIYTFSVNNAAGFVEEFFRLVELLPQNGLIIDVRGNGGGHIWAAEGLLQLLTPVDIQPEPTQFINTGLNLRICERQKLNPLGIDLGPWVESMRRSVETGAIYSRGFPITPVGFANRWGQKYHGPVVLVTDARCYSATDIFTAGFKDHNVGRVIGVDANTGAGGANVWQHGLLQALMRQPAPEDPESPYKDLPNGADMRVSMRRTLRVGQRSGTPVEDLGVMPDELHGMTKNDLQNSNEDLINLAAEILASKAVRKLSVAMEQDGSTLTLETDTAGIDRLDLYVDDRPLLSADIDNGINSFQVEEPPAGSVVVLRGYFGGELVAARKEELGG